MNYGKKQDIELGMRLCEIRESMHYTQSQFAETLDIEVSQYRRIEKGISRITIDKVRLLYETYHIDPDYLILGMQEDISEMEHIFVNSSKEQKGKFLSYMLEYIRRAVDER